MRVPELTRNVPEPSGFNSSLSLPYELRMRDFESAMQDVYDFFFDVNSHLIARGLERLDEMLRPAIMSGVLSDMLTASLAKHSRVLTEPVRDRSPMTFTEVYLAQVTTEDFRRNQRSEPGTRTATLNRLGVAKLRQGWLYRLSIDATASP